MKHLTHPIEPEEVMAYLDGELEAARATVVAAHLDQCAECQSVASALKSVSREMLAWEVEPAPETLSIRVNASSATQVDVKQKTELRKFSAIDSFSKRWLANRWVWGGAGALAALMIIAFLEAPRFQGPRPNSAFGQRVVTEATRFPYTAKLPAGAGTIGGLIGGVAGGAPAAQTGRSTGTSDELVPAAPPPASSEEFTRLQTWAQLQSGPMIARTASLTIVAKDFSGARATVEKIVNAHQGYLADLTLTNQKDSPQSLTGTLQIPADQLNDAIAELRALGHVEQESQSGEEISASYMDLLARLHNSRETEKRLTEILQQRTGKLSDVLATEQEIARVRGEIEEMESQQKQMEHRVQFTSIKLQLTEEFKATLGVPSTISFTRLRNALADGFHNAAESFFSFLEFLLNIGPALLLWALLLFWPARYAWRRLRRHSTNKASASAS